MKQENEKWIVGINCWVLPKAYYEHAKKNWDYNEVEDGVLESKSGGYRYYLSKPLPTT